MSDNILETLEKISSQLTQIEHTLTQSVERIDTQLAAVERACLSEYLDGLIRPAGGTT